MKNLSFVRHNCNINLRACKRVSLIEFNTFKSIKDNENKKTNINSCYNKEDSTQVLIKKFYRF